MQDKLSPAGKGQLPVKSDSDAKVLVSELIGYGLSADILEKCDPSQLQDIAKGARWLHKTYFEAAQAVESKGEGEEVEEETGNEDNLESALDAPIASNRVNPNSSEARYSFTEVDRKVLKLLISSSGRVSSLALSRKLEIPLTTIQRRRKRLESEFLEVAYTLKLEKLGWRKADLLVSTYKGKTAYVGKELLSHNAITRVCRSIGEHTIDLHAEIVFKNNTELLNMIEWIKSQDGVKDVVWTEQVELVGKNSAIQYDAIDKHL